MPACQLKAEPVLHGTDLGTDVEIPSESLVECGYFLVDRTVEKRRGEEVVRALSGRATLPASFNLY
jgi:hypothetical protein